ncbi:MAG: UPF0149 family protein [Acidobacteriota bacterium]
MIGVSDLTPEFIEELDEFLMSDQTPDDCMQLSDLDGFLTGIVVGPELIMPSEWMPAIWRGGEPEFKDMAQAERIAGIIMARYNEIIHLLDDEPGAFEPILFEAPDGSTLAADWAEGFMDAFGLRVDSWDALFEDEDGRLLLGPIMAQLHDKDGKPFFEGSPEEVEEIREECAQSLPYVIKGIYDFWKARRQPANVAKTRSGKKVRRNEPCPCGSGRKYKRCCGAN